MKVHGSCCVKINGRVSAKYLVEKSVKQGLVLHVSSILSASDGSSSETVASNGDS